jgi:hypothetical protein
VQQGRLGVERELFANTGLSVNLPVLPRRSRQPHARHQSRRPVPTTVTDPAGATFTVLRHPCSAPDTRVSHESACSKSTADSRYKRAGDGIEAPLHARASSSSPRTRSRHERQSARPDDGRRRRGRCEGTPKQLDITSDWGRSDLDIKHRFVFSPVYEIGAIQKENAIARQLLSNWTFSASLRCNRDLRIRL